jgi:hypothetical protein
MRLLLNNRVKLIVFAFLFITNTAFTQHASLSEIQKIREQGFDSSGLRELAIELTDGIGPRLSGTRGSQNAAEWAVNRLKAMGLSNVEIKPRGEFGKGWQTEKFYIAQTKPYYQPLIAVPQAWTGGSNGLQKAEVIMVSAQTPEKLMEYKGQLKGKVIIQPISEDLEVLFESYANRFSDEELGKFDEIPIVKPDKDPYFKSRNSNSKFDSDNLPFSFLKEFAQKEGALAVIANSGSWGVVRSYGDRNGRNLDSLGIAVIDMTYEHIARMVRLIDRGVNVEIELDINNHLVSEYSTGYNVFAEIPGTDKVLKDEIVMLGAHYDSWHCGTGGNDNGSGVIACMEVMRILKTSGLKPKRTIRIALWGSEEQGLHGSKNWVNDNVYNSDTKTKLPLHSKISAYYNFDYGTGRIRGIYINKNLALKPIFIEFFKPINDLGVSYTSMRSPGGSDHLNFTSVGIPGFAFIQDRIEYGRGYHTNMDTFERIHLGDLKQAAVVMAAIVFQTANYPEKLPRK